MNFVPGRKRVKESTDRLESAANVTLCYFFEKWNSRLGHQETNDVDIMLTFSLFTYLRIRFASFSERSADAVARQAETIKAMKTSLCISLAFATDRLLLIE